MQQMKQLIQLKILVLSLSFGNTIQGSLFIYEFVNSSTALVWFLYLMFSLKRYSCFVIGHIYMLQ